jgi:hypothetical protein
LWVTTVIVLIMAGWLIVEGLAAFLRGPQRSVTTPREEPTISPQEKREAAETVL